MKDSLSVNEYRVCVLSMGLDGANLHESSGHKKRSRSSFHIVLINFLQTGRSACFQFETYIYGIVDEAVFGFVSYTGFVAIHQAPLSSVNVEVGFGLHRSVFNGHGSREGGEGGEGGKRSDQ